MATKRTSSPIERRRVERGMSAYALAKAAGTTPSHIARIERGLSSPRVELALAIADALAADVRVLFPARAA